VKPKLELEGSDASQPGDVIQQVNHQSVANVKEYSQAVGATRKDDSVLLLVNRDGETMFLAACSLPPGSTAGSELFLRGSGRP
jgi:S1-C subfamily serine protease